MTTNNVKELLNKFQHLDAQEDEDHQETENLAAAKPQGGIFKKNFEEALKKKAGKLPNGIPPIPLSPSSRSVKDLLGSFEMQAEARSPRNNEAKAKTTIRSPRFLRKHRRGDKDPGTSVSPKAALSSASTKEANGTEDGKGANFRGSSGESNDAQSSGYDRTPKAEKKAGATINNSRPTSEAITFSVGSKGIAEPEGRKSEMIEEKSEEHICLKPETETDIKPDSNIDRSAIITEHEAIKNVIKTLPKAEAGSSQRAKGVKEGNQDHRHLEKRGKLKSKTEKGVKPGIGNDDGVSPLRCPATPSSGERREMKVELVESASCIPSISETNNNVGELRRMSESSGIAVFHGGSTLSSMTSFQLEVRRNPPPEVSTQAHPTPMANVKNNNHLSCMGGHVVDSSVSEMKELDEKLNAAQAHFTEGSSSRISFSHPPQRAPPHLPPNRFVSPLPDTSPPPPVPARCSPSHPPPPATFPPSAPQNVAVYPNGRLHGYDDDEDIVPPPPPPPDSNTTFDTDAAVDEAGAHNTNVHQLGRTDSNISITIDSAVIPQGSTYGEDEKGGLCDISEEGSTSNLSVNNSSPRSRPRIRQWRRRQVGNSRHQSSPAYLDSIGLSPATSQGSCSSDTTSDMRSEFSVSPIRSRSPKRRLSPRQRPVSICTSRDISPLNTSEGRRPRLRSTGFSSTAYYSRTTDIKESRNKDLLILQDGATSLSKLARSFILVNQNSHRNANSGRDRMNKLQYVKKDVELLTSESGSGMLRRPRCLTMVDEYCKETTPIINETREYVEIENGAITTFIRLLESNGFSERALTREEAEPLRVLCSLNERLVRNQATSALKHAKKNLEYQQKKKIEDKKFTHRLADLISEEISNMSRTFMVDKLNKWNANSAREIIYDPTVNRLIISKRIEKTKEKLDKKKKLQNLSFGSSISNSSQTSETGDAFTLEKSNFVRLSYKGNSTVKIVFRKMHKAKEKDWKIKFKNDNEMQEFVSICEKLFGKELIKCGPSSVA
eukprot:CAMPEP_0184490386 /NCGR_PEP_ID=MMETSP0113_2-20130426/17752_1 /TAXON_ID=91329 /ORGANISM="Norrisiella sphaerica, Strain BC52" /LENGTH=1004 /DNA_ID=CAMNT_0026874245 /DNA_START=49 /DNA_END=3063 /DNA_ORIENTATION=-